ncbi:MULTISPECIES: ABC transporter ATP-binding protein [unclassified Leptolyngbya]|uniref:ABC transporter ATP-binding protein n=1 Tax=unclassified Leptolyngbya TaxID=2650499 RepID=UPI00168704A8|nr:MULTISPECIES: ABC transporter ATP-binding protein [unclassified Leptolyngbya]MBD1912674.1 ABC transporter ATP-binding protein [Leptolyngbya sp. FACHB-8]MBD2154703.1 ABC transporter ATP-binding protein [Leptolyngbya sp. FACHB-16]
MTHSFTQLPVETNTSSQSPAFLEIENLVKAFPNTHRGHTVVLDQINLTLGEQEFVSIVGHSGCGKSTLLRLVAGLEKPSSGSIRLEGQPIRKPGSERMMVFQQYCLLPWLTVRQNIRLAVDEVFETLRPAEKSEIVNDHLAMVNLTAAADKYPDQLSGGMKQRVGIARALAVRPKMLLMDEPFGALDALTRGKLQQQVLNIWESQRQAVMMITHDIDEAIYMSDRIILMTNGPAATIGEVIEVPFPHPRNRDQIRHDPLYGEIHARALDFLYHRFDKND